MSVTDEMTGYKGMVCVDEQLTGVKMRLRKSMKKFNATIGPAETPDHTFSVVDYSQPYSFARLNNDIIVLISSLGITNETLLLKQAEYFDWLCAATSDLSSAVDLLSSLGEYAMAERAGLCPDLGLNASEWIAYGRGSSSGEIPGSTLSVQNQKALEHDVGFVSFPFQAELLVYVRCFQIYYVRHRADSI